MVKGAQTEVQSTRVKRKKLRNTNVTTNSKERDEWTERVKNNGEKIMMMASDGRPLHSAVPHSQRDISLKSVSSPTTTPHSGGGRS